MTGPPLPVSRGHAPARRELSGSDGGHRSGGQRAPQSGGAAKASTERERTLSVGRKTPQSAGTVEFLRHRRGSAATWTGAERQRWRLPRAAAAADPAKFSGGSESAARIAPRTTARPPASAAADLRHEIGDLLGVLAVDEVGRHLALAAGAALLDRVDDERLRRVELVEVRAALAHGVRRRERVARRAPLGEDLAPALVRGGQLHAAGRLLGAPRGGDHQRRDKNPEQQHQHANADGHRAPAAPRRPARALGVPPPPLNAAAMTTSPTTRNVTTKAKAVITAGNIQTHPAGRHRPAARRQRPADRRSSHYRRRPWVKLMTGGATARKSSAPPASSRTRGGASAGSATPGRSPAADEALPPVPPTETPRGPAAP